MAYVVYSYATPIAWTDTAGVVTIPPVKYSLTTTGHQSLLYALDRDPDSFPADPVRPARRTATRSVGMHTAPWRSGPVQEPIGPDFCGPDTLLDIPNLAYSEEWERAHAA